MLQWSMGSRGLGTQCQVSVKEATGDGEQENVKSWHQMPEMIEGSDFEERVSESNI